jgi:type IV pilus assembly protein PilY1
VTRHPQGGFMIVFGTGRYLATTDISSADVQTLHGIWDKDDTQVAAEQLQSQKIEADVQTAGNGDVYRFSTHRVGPPPDNLLADDQIDEITRNAYFASKRGWYIDLPTTGERVIADAAIRGGRAVFASMIPSSDVCSPGGTGWIIEIDVLTGNRSDSATFDVNNDRRTTTADYLRIGSTATGTNNASGWRIDALPSQAAVMSFKSDTLDYQLRLVNTSKATTETKAGSQRAGSRQRVMWRVSE